MNNITNKISFSNFDIYEKLLEIASKHVSLNDQDDFLRLGLFGYVTEGMAASMRDSALQKTMLYNESFLNSAIIPDSVYNYAKTFNVSVQNATPARALVSITIPQSDFDQYATEYSRTDYPKFYTTANNNGEIYNGIIIDRDGYFNVDSYIFKLEKSIILSKLDDNRIKADYILTEQNSSTFYMSDPYAGPNYYENNEHIVLTQDGSGNIILHNVLVYQFDVSQDKIQITSDNILNKKVFYQTFKNQFANISASYIKSGVVYPIDLYYSNVDVAIGTSIQNPYYAYYSLDDDGVVKINFTSGSKGFIPEINSTIQLNIYTTSGTNINSTISGTYAYIQSTSATRAVSILVQFESSLSGGRNKPSLSQVKNQIINAISTRNIILSEEDLNDYFNILTQSWSGFDGKITFIKKRDDILRRIFGAYSLFRSGLDTSGSPVNNASFISTVVPTNTINATFNITSEDSPDNIYIGSGTYFALDTDNTDEMVFKKSDSTTGEYFCPFTIKAMLSPVRMVKYISEMIDSTMSAHIDVSADNIIYPKDSTIIPKTIRAIRNINSGNGEISKSFQFELLIQSNVNLQENMSLTGDGTNKISFTNGDDYLGEIDIGEVNIITQQAEQEESYLSTISFSVHVNGESSLGVDANGNDVLKIGSSSVPSEVYISIRLQAAISDDIFNLVFKTDSQITLFNSMNRLMTSDISYTTMVDGSNKYIEKYRIDSIPVVHKSFLNNGNTNTTYGISSFIKQVSNHIMLLKQSLNKLEANTSYDFKFYNTCGRAQYYDCMKTDLDLLLVITLAKQYADNDTVKNQIRDYIRRYIDICNNDKEFYMTGLIVACIGNFNQTVTSADVIKNIEFRSMNGAMDDHILPFSTNIGKEYMFVPEWFGLPFNPTTNDENIIFVSE